MIKVEWDHDWRDGSFDSRQVFATWSEALEKVKNLAEESGHEVFGFSIAE